MTILSDYFTAYFIWRDLTVAQRAALRYPWGEPDPRVKANLAAKGLWDDQGATRAGLAVALCRFIADEADRPVSRSA